MNSMAVFGLAVVEGLILIQLAARRYPLSALALAWCCGRLMGA